MAKQCRICEKKGKIVWRRVKLRADKYNPTIKRKQYPNLQWVRVPLDIKKEIFKKFRGKRILACRKCIRTLEKYS
jgi:ribosomal protein L28